jgi:AraC-like DNA-binding protein
LNLMLEAMLAGQVLVLLALWARAPLRPPGLAWMAWVLLALALTGVADLAPLLGRGAAASVLQGLGSAAFLCLGPGVWFYVRTVIGQPPSRWRALRHHAPAVLVLLVQSVSRHSTEADATSGLWLVGLHLLGYLAASLRDIWRARARLQDEVSNLAGKDLRWLSKLLALLACLAPLWWFSAAWGWAGGEALTQVLLLTAATWVGLHAAAQTPVLADDSPPRATVAQVAAEPAPDVAPAAHPTGAASKYQRAPLSADLIATLHASLPVLMQTDKPHLQADITLADLATALGCSAHQLSQFLSVHQQESFFDFINRHRVEAVCAAMTRLEAVGTRSLLELALVSGVGFQRSLQEGDRADPQPVSPPVAPGLKVRAHGSGRRPWEKATPAARGRTLRTPSFHDPSPCVVLLPSN